jgi:hypothetical protein
MRGGHNKKSIEQHLAENTFRSDRHGILDNDVKSFVENRADSLKDRLLFYEAEITKPEIIADSKKLKLYTDNYTKLMRLYFTTIKIPKIESKESTLETALKLREEEG